MGTQVIEVKQFKFEVRRGLRGHWRPLEVTEIAIISPIAHKSIVPFRYAESLAASYIERNFGATSKLPRIACTVIQRSPRESPKFQ